jgi:hypothetical protein
MESHVDSTSTPSYSAVGSLKQRGSLIKWYVSITVGSYHNDSSPTNISHCFPFWIEVKYLIFAKKKTIKISQQKERKKKGKVD